jgi:hypothetical protein
VRMRSRNPCFLCRRRLLGWYVRFMWMSFQGRDARGRGIGPQRQLPSTTGSSRRGPAPPAYGTAALRPASAYSTTPRHGEALARHADPGEIQWTNLCTIGCQRLTIRIASAHRVAPAFPTVSIRRSFPHELSTLWRTMFTSSQGGTLGRHDRPRRPMDTGQAERS